MRRCSGIKCKIDGRNSPPPDMETKPRLHGVIREVAECVIEEMRKDVGKHHEAASEPHLANAYPAQPRHDARCRVYGTYIENCGGLQSHVEFLLYCLTGEKNLQKMARVSLRKKARGRAQASVAGCRWRVGTRPSAGVNRIRSKMRKGRTPRCSRPYL